MSTKLHEIIIQRMQNVNVTLFIDSPIVKTFLFECTKYWASNGSPVHYISSYTQENLPPSLQGVKSDDTPTYYQFMQITFLSAPQANDLVDYMINLRKSTHMPKVLVVEDITSYAENSSESDFLLMCSCLKNTAYMCSRANNSTAFLIVSSKFKTDRLNQINLILQPTKIWRTYDNKDNGKTNNYTLREISLNPVDKASKELHFSLFENEDEGILRLNGIKHLFEEDSNFNNTVM